MEKKNEEITKIKNISFISLLLSFILLLLLLFIINILLLTINYDQYTV